MRFLPVELKLMHVATKGQQNKNKTKKSKNTMQCWFFVVDISNRKCFKNISL
jgi:hypothetical protein